MISAWVVGVHVLTDDEVDPEVDRQRRAEDQAGQVLPDGRDPGLPGGARRGHGRRSLGAPRGLRFHAIQGVPPRKSLAPPGIELPL